MFVFSGVINLKKKTVILVNIGAAFLVVIVAFVLYIVSYVPQSERDKSSVKFIDEYIYSGFELHLEDFERIKDIVVEIEKDGPCWYSVSDSKGASPAKLMFKKRSAKAGVKYTKVNLSPDEQQSIDAIYQGVKYDLDIYAGEYGIRFLYGVCEGGFIYTEDIEKHKETVDLDAMRFVHIKDNWYGMIYTIR